MSNNNEFSEKLNYLQNNLKLLADKPEETPEATLRALWFVADGQIKSVHEASTGGLPVLDQNGLEKLNLLIEKRIAGIPLAHLTGRQNFMEIELTVGPDALVPRKETELLGYAALDILKTEFIEKQELIVIDVCTGSGNLALALAFYMEKARVYGSDLSESAVNMAKSNSEFLGLANRVEFRCGDLLEPFSNSEFYGQVDLLTCNPPYISSGKLDTMPEEIIIHEPKLAFDGGPFGVRILQKFIQEAPKYLCKSGWFAFEVGLGQGEPLRKRLLNNEKFIQVKSICDRNDDIRALLVQVR